MKFIDMERWPRRQQFELYRQMAFPYVGICAEVDATNMLAYCQQHQQSSYRAMVYAILLVSQQLPWMRQRIRGQQVVEHSRISAGATALNADQQLRFTRLPFVADWPSFDAKARQVVAGLQHSENLFDDSCDSDDDGLIFMSCLPWLRFSQFTHPVPLKPDCSIPRIGWGKYSKQGERTTVPFSIQIHHGLADGLHIAQFYQQLEQLLATPAQWLTPLVES